MSTIRVNNVTDELGTGAPDFPNGITIDTVTVSGKIVHTGDTDTSIGFPINDTITMDTAGTERLRIDSAGAITVGGTITSGGMYGEQYVVGVNQSGAATYSYTEVQQTAASSFGTVKGAEIYAVLLNNTFNNTGTNPVMGVDSNVYVQGNAGTTVSKGIGIRSDISTLNSKLLDATAFMASHSGVFGTYYGFRHEPRTFGSADNSYAFYSNFASAANTFNFYANGTAPNYFAGNVSIGTTTSTSTLNVNGTIGGTVIATQAEAEAGTDNTKLMTPLRVEQAINANIPEGIPAGAVSMFAMSTAPTGWLKANGAAISRTTYATLFAAIGTTFGAGDGSTTFNIPDLRGEFMRSWDDARGIDSGRAFGSAQSSQNLSHSHGASSDTHAGHSHTLSYNTSSSSSNIGVAFGNNKAAVINATFPTTTTRIDTGGAHSHAITVNANGGTESRPRNIALLACIKF